MFRKAQRPKMIEDQQTKASLEYWRYCTMKIVQERAGIVHNRLTNQIMTLKHIYQSYQEANNLPDHSHKTNSKVDLTVLGE